MRYRSVVASGLTVVVALLVAACAHTPAVETERAEPIPTTAADSTTTGPTTSPTTNPTTSPTTGAPSTIDPDDVDTGLDDPLFPDLGAPGVDVLAYDVVLDISPDDGTFAARVGISVAVDPALPVLALDAEGLVIDRAVVDGSPAGFEQQGDELLVDLPATRDTTVDVELSYTAAPDETFSAAGLPAGWFRTASGSYVLNQPDGARRWLPSNDHPSDKARWRFELSVPDGLTAVANGDLVQRGSGARPWIWELDEQMSTYLVLLAVGRYDVVVDEPIESIDGDTIPIVHVVPEGAGADFAPYLDLTAPQMAFYEALLGPYPLDGYGLAFLDSVPGLAMETQGRSLFSVADFGDGRLGYLQHLLLGHEIVHQWLGNAVGPASWSDIWLNESFATYFHWVWLEEVGLTTVEREASASLAARQNGRHATGTPVHETMFGFESYDGGAVIVHALRRTIGDDAFFALLRRWVADHVGTSQTTDDFVELAEEIAGRDLGDFFDDWLYATDLPDAFPG